MKTNYNKLKPKTFKDSVLDNNFPNFLVIGAAKSGTTSVYYYLSKHPEIFLPKLKEINFFAYAGQNQIGFWAKTFEEYLKFFENVKSESAIGEVTPYYLPSPIAAEKIKHYIPQVKLIAILRNPVERAYSHYLMALRAGKTKMSIENAWSDITVNYINEGFYFKHLSRYYKLFDKDKILILFYDDLKNSPEIFIRNLFSFLNVDTQFIPDFNSVHAKGYIPRSRFVNSILNSNFIKFRLKPLLPDYMLEAGIRLKSLAGKAPPELSEEIKLKIFNIYKDDLLMLQDLLKKDLSHWLNFS